ncbi:histidine phosphatase family protein [Cohnella caldifontis]|uniref:histidine phosphatase family protein n=1 Tax=Cohnella caldifontis TaxID=3027471 RepID=UPI0023EB35AD|nr:histidine phosphatase family protein [Cohnella sp. YIM B05605]
MTEVALIRHGSTFWNKEGRMQGHSENPLDDEGWSQARKLAERLSSEHWDVLISSDLQRARQTAAALLEKLELSEIRYDRRLREMDRGLAAGTTEEERIARWGPDWRRLADRIGIESDDEAAQRGSGLLREVAGRYPGMKILLISHGMILRNALRGILPELDIAEPLRNASVTRLRHDGSGWVCERYNCTSHLEERGEIG